MKNNIIDLLYRLGLSTRDSLQVFHSKVRDRENLNVLKCGKSGVIVLEEIITNQFYYESDVNPLASSERHRLRLKIPQQFDPYTQSLPK